MLLRTMTAALMLVTMVACGDGSASEEQDEVVTDLEIVATDFAFQLSSSSVPAGPVGTILINEGKEPHQAGYYLLDEGVTFEDFMEAVLEDDSAIPQLASGGRQGHMRPLAGGEDGMRPAEELEAGSYAVLCSIRDPDTGKNHYELGMAAALEVD